MGNTTIIGKPTNTIGDKDSMLVLRGSSIKILWGNKFIDVIKNGKLVSKDSSLLKVVSSPNDISDNGIYLISENNEVWICIDGTKVNLSGEIGTTYVSFLAELTEVTSDLKYTALTNAGLYYETLEEALLAGIKAGIIFVVGENKLYLANNGLLSEYLASSASSTSLLNVEDLKISSDGSNITISSPNLQFEINNKLAMALDTQLKSYLDIAMLSGTYILSENANSTTGYRLYIKNGKSVLEIDNIIYRLPEVPKDYNDEKYNLTIPNIAWTKELIKLAVPKGTITMFNGASEIPEGWAICDGTNGTPNLIGKFIKASNTVGDNESELNESNEFTLTKEHLPEHNHPHKAHTHGLNTTLSGTTEASGDLTIPLKLSDYNYGIESVEKTFISSVSGEGVTSESGTVNGVSNIKTLGGDVVGGSHSHSISLTIYESVTSTISEEDTLEWTNKPIKIEPRSYSLIFIMKL